MRIGIANHCTVAIAALRRTLALDAACELAWVAANGEEAVTLARRDAPDLLLIDPVMPGLDDVEATRRIVAGAPCAVMVVTDLGRNAARVFEAMNAGAIDAVDTPPHTASDAQLLSGPLLRKIRHIRATLARRGGSRALSPAVGAGAAGTATLVAIGASAGGPAALATLLSGLPAGFPAAVVAVQHVDEAFSAGMASWLNDQCALPVRLAREGEPPAPGVVLLAGTNNHLSMHANTRIHYTEEPADYLYRPSIDVFFASVARHWRRCAVGLLLTGMGRDGAQGLKAMRDRGFLTIAQDQATSAVYGMPKAAVALDAAAEVLPLPEIAPRLLRACTPHPADRRI